MDATNEFRYVVNTNTLLQLSSGLLQFNIPCLSLNIHHKPTEEIIQVKS
jgi:hypothetical protein